MGGPGAAGDIGFECHPQRITDVNTALAAIKRYGDVKDGMFVPRNAVSEEKFLSESAVEPAREITDQVCQALKDLSRLQGEENRLASRQAGLRPWASLDMPLEMTGTAHTLIRMGVFPSGTDVGAVRTALGRRTLRRRSMRSARTSSRSTVCSSATGRRRRR